MRCDHVREVRFDVGRDNADRVDEDLQLTGVVDEPSCQLGVFDRRALRDQRAHQLEMDAAVNRVGEILFHTLASRIKRRQLGELAPRTSARSSAHVRPGASWGSE